MKRFYQTFKALPPEFKLVLGFLGLGTMAGVFYLLERQLGGRRTTLIILGVAVVLALLVWLVIRLFGWTGRRRAARMDYELSSGEQGGPQSMDVSAKIKANNEKFFKAVRELKKTVGISVYELPWYIVIGDSGCGKTKLVNEGGLTFSTGKPEGYQLGTLDYNWWFTEDAIFVDMAGRLCNPQDDRDRREWMAFLDTIARGRKGYPINGALVCVSTEHLLRDPPEKHESDAHVALERLRDLQSKLGVTFATYLVVTKCDKILGFMQFFDRAERDIAVKNQIFGWSRPGPFNEPYDPEKFKGDFGKLYGTLNDLRLRRMNDDAEEIDLGLACAFPEEFRGLFDPLQTYIRTLFPFIRNPRAVKNLLFRGVYFTSATQEGELILKHLTERLGNEAASQFPPLDDLYPHKRPHFIKDVLMRKVFPEHGLVFRNEQQVVRNRRLSRALMIGTCVLAVLLFGGFAWSIHKYSQIIDEPRAWADKTAGGFAGLRAADAPAQAAQAEQYWNRLSDNRRSARVLCGFFCNPMEPGESLEKIRAELVEKVLKGALGEVGDALRNGNGLAGDAKAYRDALEEYIRWSGCREQPASMANVGADSFEKLTGLVKSSSPLMKDAKFTSQAKWYFDEVRNKDSRLSRNPAALLAEAGTDADGTITTAVQKVFDYFKDRNATFSDKNLDPTVQEWGRILNACAEAEKQYDDILKTCSGADKMTLEGLEERRKGFLNTYKTWTESLDKLQGQQLKSLTDALWTQRGDWIGYRKRLEDAGGACGNGEAAKRWLTALDTMALERTMWESLCKTKPKPLASGAYDQALFLGPDAFKEHVKNVYDADVLGHILARGEKEGQGGTIKLSKEAEAVRKALGEFNSQWSGVMVTGCLPEKRPQTWKDALGDHIDFGVKHESGGPLSGLDPRWKGEELNALLTQCGELVHRGKGTCLLQSMSDYLLGAAEEKNWGFAALTPYAERTKLQRSAYAIPKPPPVGKPDTEESISRPASPAKPPDGSKHKRGQIVLGPDASPAAPNAPPVSGTSTQQIPNCATHAFLNEQAEIWWNLLDLLDGMEDHVLDIKSNSEGTSLLEKTKQSLRTSANAYLTAYLSAWHQAYLRVKLNALEQLVKRGQSWEDLAVALAGGHARDEVAGELSAALSEILESVPLGDHTANGVPWPSPDKPKPVQEVCSWWRDSLMNGKDWPRDEFATKTSRTGRINTPPWKVVQEDAVKAWKDLADEIAENKELEDRLNRLKPGVPAIPWGNLSKLQKDKGLYGEPRLMGALGKFERWAQGLLDARLTGILVQIQKKHFPEAPVDSGWPYLKGLPYTDNALDVVPIQKFREFVNAVTKAGEAFKGIEEGLPSDLPGFTLRQEYYEGCRQWAAFLGETKLEVDIKECPPKEVGGGWAAGFEECRKAAYNVQLTMGSKAPIVTNCESNDWKGQRITWNWAEAANNPWTTAISRLMQGETVVFAQAERRLGLDSPLALVAYLERYGKPGNDRTTWYVVHDFEVRFGGGQVARKVAQALRFALGKPLPRPVRKLEPVTPPEPPKWDDVSTGPR